MPDYLSAEVKDLINRMLQPLPLKRIRMKEIREHPWFVEDLPESVEKLMAKSGIFFDHAN